MRAAGPTSAWACCPLGSDPGVLGRTHSSQRCRRSGRDEARMNEETPRPRAKPGPKPGSAGARRTGFAADPERARRAGRLGAAAVKERYGVEHYQRLGALGGRKLVEARGKEHLAAIGK